MKKRNKGFTLIEVIVVIAIIAILASIAIPSFSNAISNSKTVVCASNRKNITTILQSKIILGEIEPSELDSEFQKMGITCPDKGKLHVKYNEDTKTITVECTKHTETITQGVLDKFTEMCKNFKDYSHYANNAQLRKAMLEMLGGTWNSIGFSNDSNNYHIQPYWDTEANEMYIFAGSEKAPDGSWYTGYIYNADTATWYHGKSFSFVNPDNIHSWDDIWDKMQNEGWKPVEVEYEK